MKSATSDSLSSVLNENDYDSPGYEYLRSYQNTINLYNKLIALNYQNEFCSLYKCRKIHRYYFSMPSDNVNEQQFIFLCLCAWLIKHKCQMNLQLNPEDYEDPDSTIDTILEALRLLQADGDEPLSRSAFNTWLGFPPSRLRNSYGPEIVWTMNVLADRALELQKANQRQQQTSTKSTTNNSNQRKSSSSSPRVIYRTGDQSKQQKQQLSTAADFITIGQPLVGGGLTTRPLGTYRIDDDALVLAGGCESYWAANNIETNGTASKNINRTTRIEGGKKVGEQLIDYRPLTGDEAIEWYKQVDLVSAYLESIDLTETTATSPKKIPTQDDNNKNNNEELLTLDWHEYLDSFERSRDMIKAFLEDFKEPLETIESRIRRELQVIWSKEKHIQTKASEEIEQFLSTWRQYSMRLKSNSELERKTNEKMELFDRLNDKLRQTKLELEKRNRDLAEGRHLKELETKIEHLRSEKRQFDLRIGLLMSVYANKQTQLLNNHQQNNSQNMDQKR